MVWLEAGICVHKHVKPPVKCMNRNGLSRFM